MMTLNISRMNKIQDLHTDPEFPSFDAVSFKPALAVGGLLKLGYHVNRLQIRKDDGRIDVPSENLTKSLGNTSFYAPVSVISGRKPLKPLSRVAGPVGKEEVLGGVNRL